jgi:hypothetical protein
MLCEYSTAAQSVADGQPDLAPALTNPSSQGQYTAILPTINFSSRLFQGITNILGLVCVCIVAILYAHIGCKVFYRNILRGYFRAPSLSSPKSHMYWSATVCGYFLLAWVLGSAIPNIADLNTIVGAACILQFTYTFPPLLLVGHWVQKDASEGDIPWHPGLAAWSTRRDTWREAARWKRGFKKYWYAKVGLVSSLRNGHWHCHWGFMLMARSSCHSDVWPSVYSAFTRGS